MRLCIYEDQAVDQLEPIVLARPLVQVWLGASTLLGRFLKRFRPARWGLWVRPHLSALAQELFPDIPINDLDWLQHDVTLLVNARWLPPTSLNLPDTPHVGICAGQVAYVHLAEEKRPSLPSDWTNNAHLFLETLPCVATTGTMLTHPWDVIAHNELALLEDGKNWLASPGERCLPPGVHLVGDPENVYIHPSVTLEAPVVLNAQDGPIILDQDVKVHAFSRIEGPCYVGAKCVLYGARVRRGTTIGPGCRIGGEVEASIFQGWANKYHDGFIGHSWIGEWVNIAAGVQISDLRHDYKTVPVCSRGQRQDSGLTKLGAFIGDHTKLGLGVLVNTGSLFGVFCSILPGPSYAPSYIPSFSRSVRGELRPERDVENCLETARRVMARRQQLLTPCLRDLYRYLYLRTNSDRLACMDSVSKWALRATA
ncbi:MAG: putative sugar nucleotidyl transferase [Gemmatales bacterium]|nr:putative sugar nucleotidyl transferase [Gemmatales bacterium]MDW8222682.1 putative sugar nucleotidyl transferase [Gemmatales bacterium]